MTVTVEEMTRFFLSLDSAVDTIFAAARSALPGEIYIPKVPSARITDLARVLIGNRDIPVEYTGIRPGEKLHEIMVSEEECSRTLERDGYYVISPMLPELQAAKIDKPALKTEYSSSNVTLDDAALLDLIAPFVGR